MYQEDVTVANDYNAASGSFAYTVNSNGERLFIARFDLDDASVATATYNAVALTFIGRIANPSFGAVEFWGLKNPASGSNTFAWTLSVSDKHVAAATGMSGINQTVPWRNFGGATGNGTAPSIVMAGTTVEHRVFDSIAVQEGATGVTVTQGAGQTKQYEDRTTGAPSVGNVVGSGSVETGGAVSTTMSWTLNLTRQWTIAAVEILPVVEGEIDMDAISVMTPLGSAVFKGQCTMTAQGLMSIDGTRVRLGFVTMAGQGGLICEPVFPQGDAYLPITVPQVLFIFPNTKEFKMVWVLQELNRPKRLDLGGLRRVILRANGLPDKECIIEDANDGVAVYFTTPGEFPKGWWTGKLVMTLLTMWDSAEPPDPQFQEVSQEVTVETPDFLMYAS